MSNPRPRQAPGPRGLSRQLMLQEAVGLMEQGGGAAFSLRKLGERLGCDPMAVLYHFKTKEGLQRAMADWLTASLPPLPATPATVLAPAPASTPASAAATAAAMPAAVPWQDRLAGLAFQYRDLALRYPHTFGLMPRFLNTGMADVGRIEMVQGALREAGLADADIPAACLGWYATVFGLALAETGGLIRAATPAELAEVAALPEGEYPLLRRFMPELAGLDPGRVYGLTLELLHRGIQARARGPQAP